jgi:hypothetical protein
VSAASFRPVHAGQRRDATTTAADRHSIHVTFDWRGLFVWRYKESREQAGLVKTVVSNSTFDRGSPAPTCTKPFDVFANGSRTEEWLAALDDFRNWLIREAA